MKIIVGLGNPGKEYEQSRHNAGFSTINMVAEALNTNFNQTKFQAEIATARLNGEQILLLKPLTFMNLSGQAVTQAVNFYKVDYADVLIIFDDMDLEIGTIRLRKNGSAGGHNGMKSIIACAGTNNINRIKIGIGHPKYHNVIDFVLTPFTKEETPIIQEAFNFGTKAALAWLEQGIEKAMNQYNSKKQ